MTLARLRVARDGGLCSILHAQELEQEGRLLRGGSEHGQPLADLGAGDILGVLGDAEDVSQQPQHRAERNPAGVGEARCLPHCRTVAATTHEKLVAQAALAHAGLAGDTHDLRRRVHGRRKCLAERGKLLLPADEP